MPEEGIQLRDKKEFMSQEETILLAKTFVNLGVTKIRLTGGEPLIKKNFREILEELAKLPVEISITTNGILLDVYFDDLKAAGCKSIEYQFRFID
jgi:molybdenum cofactor biosynthesis enzyme MoaA